MFDTFNLEMFTSKEQFGGGLLTVKSAAEVTLDFLTCNSSFPLYRAIVSTTANEPNVIVVGFYNLTKQNTASELVNNTMWYLSLYVLQSLRINNKKRLCEMQGGRNMQ